MGCATRELVLGSDPTETAALRPLATKLLEAVATTGDHETLESCCVHLNVLLCVIFETIEVTVSVSSIAYYRYLSIVFAKINKIWP